MCYVFLVLSFSFPIDFCQFVVEFVNILLSSLLILFAQGFLLVRIPFQNRDIQYMCIYIFLFNVKMRV